MPTANPRTQLDVARLKTVIAPPLSSAAAATAPGSRTAAALLPARARRPLRASTRISGERIGFRAASLGGRGGPALRAAVTTRLVRSAAAVGRTRGALRRRLRPRLTGRALCVRAPRLRVASSRVPLGLGCFGPILLTRFGAFGPLLARVLGAVAALLHQVLAVIHPVFPRVFAMVVVVVPRVVVHVGAAVPAVRTVVVVVVDRRSDHHAGGEPDQPRRDGVARIVLNDHGRRGGRLRVDGGRRRMRT